jgi:hypothetical protein
MIKIKALRNGFRRCGMAHPDTEVEHPDDTFTAEQLEILQAESMLLVEVIDDAKAAKAKAAAEKAAADKKTAEKAAE